MRSLVSLVPAALLLATTNVALAEGGAEPAATLHKPCRSKHGGGKPGQLDSCAGGQVCLERNGQGTGTCEITCTNSPAECPSGFECRKLKDGMQLCSVKGTGAAAEKAANSGAQLRLLARDLKHRLESITRGELRNVAAAKIAAACAAQPSCAGKCLTAMTACGKEDYTAITKCGELFAKDCPGYDPKLGSAKELARRLTALVTEVRLGLPSEDERAELDKLGMYWSDQLANHEGN